MTDEGRGKGMETCFPWAARRPIFKWFVRDALLNTSSLLFFLSFFKSMAPLHPGWSAPHRVIHNNILVSQTFHPQSKFISCYDITVELQRLEELYAGREEKLRSK